MNEIMVSVCILSYNHEKYLRDCLEGVVKQQTSFPIEVLVHDDASTDSSPVIIKDYQHRYPNIIKPILQVENQYSKQEGSILSRFVFPSCLGKYIAICEGDDYWTDPLKLQKQVDFMEKNPEYSLCCHRYKIYNQNSDTWENDYVTSLFEANPEGFTFGNKDNFETWITKTMTLVYRADCLPAEYLTIPYKYSRDVHLNYHLLLKGKGYCLPFDGAVYRRQDGGTFSALNTFQQTFINYKVYSELLSFNKEDVDLVSMVDTCFYAVFRHLCQMEKGKKVFWLGFLFCVVERLKRGKLKSVMKVFRCLL